MSSDQRKNPNDGSKKTNGTNPATEIGAETFADHKQNDIDAQGSQTTFRDIGQYKIVSKIGEGGMGSVYLAQQVKPIQRQVALKVIKSNARSKNVITRFEAERQALAMMEHPNIARILDGGTTDDGQPYFAMELVNGIPITEFCDENKLTLNERLGLFINVCSAVQHAHQKGVIHRDLKPSNILVGQNDGKPVPKVIDFGLAKALDSENLLTEKSMETNIGQVVGTFKYMSPEQANSGTIDIDTRTDVYALGVILYELLTGSTPIDQKTLQNQALMKVLELIRDHEPQRPSTRLSSLNETASTISDQRQMAPGRLGQILRGDLDWVVMKALEKDRGRRYESASGFADDVRRFLENEPVVARPPSTSYRLRKFIGKNRGMVASLTTITALLFAAIIGTSWFAVKASQSAEAELAQRKIADEKAAEAVQQKRAADNARIAAETSAKRSRDVLSIVSNSFASANPNQGANADMSAKDVLFNAKKIMNDSELDELGKAKLLGTLTESFRGLGEYSHSKDAALQVIDIQKRMLGPNAPETLFAMNSLALTKQSLGEHDESVKIWEQLVEDMKAHEKATPLEILEVEHNLAAGYARIGKLTEAIEMHAKVLEQRKNLLGDEGYETLISMVSLADAYQKNSRPKEAKGLLETAIPVLKKNVADDHPFLLLATGNMAILHEMSGDWNKAIEQHEFMLEKNKKKFGPIHPDTLLGMNNLALAYSSAGRSSDAITMYKKALKHTKEKFGVAHHQTLSILNNLADALLVSGRIQEAIPIMKQSFNGMKDKMGAKHPDTILIMNNLARAYLMGGKLRESAELYEKTVALARDILGEKHQTTIIAMSNLAGAYSGLGQTAKSVSLFEQGVAATREVMGPEHPLTLINMNNLANGYRILGRYDESLKLNLATLELKKKRIGPDHPSTLETMGNLGLAYYNLAQNEKAIPLIKETVEKMKRVLGESHPNTLVNIGNLAIVYQANGNIDEAIELQRKTAKILSEQQGDDHPTTLLAVANLASSLQTAGKYEEALKIYVDIRERTEAKLGPEHPYTMQASNNLASYYWQTKQYSKAIELAQETIATRERVFGRSHPKTMQTVALLGSTFLDNGETGKAIELLEEVAEEHAVGDLAWVRQRLREAYILDKRIEKLRQLVETDIANARTTHSPESAELANVLVMIGLDQIKVEDYEAAAKVLAETYEIRKKLMPKSWVTFNTQSALGAAYLGLKQTDSARPLLENGYSGMKERAHSIPHAFRQLRLTEAVQRLIDLAEATDDSNLASKWKVEFETLKQDNKR